MSHDSSYIGGGVTPAVPYAFATGPAALVVAHPGHELRVHGWLEMARPKVFVLTDGSGPGNLSRLPSTTTVIESAGAGPGEIYGRCTDAALYAALLGHDVALFTGLAGELATALVADRIDCVIGDAAEGYNPTHDVCRLVIDAAARVAARVRNAPIATYEFMLMEAPDRPRTGGSGGVCVELAPAALDRKLSRGRRIS